MRVDELAALRGTGQYEELDNPDQAEFEQFCQEHAADKKLRYLGLTGNARGMKIDDFAPLSQLSNLKELRTGSPITQEQFEQICRHAHSLDELHIYHAGKLSSLEPLRLMPRLKGLTITTPTGWISKLLVVPDFWPLADLRDLTHLNLAGIKAAKDEAKPLEGLPKLRDVIVIKRYWPTMRKDLL